MKLVIITSQNPDQLFNQIKPIFNQIKNKSVDPKTFYNLETPIFRNNSYLVKYISKKKNKILDIYF